MFFFWSAQTQKTNERTAWSLVDRGGGIWDFQHCIVITRGQEERIPKTASVVGQKLTHVGKKSFHVFDRYEIYIQALTDFINGKLIVFEHIV